MEGKQHTPSVIARLMGLDELPPKQPLPSKQLRVLSETYLQKTASIGLREKSSFSIGFSPGINTQKRQVVKDVSGVEIPDIYSQEKASQNAAKSKMHKTTDSRFSSMKEKHSYFKETEGISEGSLSENSNFPRYSQLAYQFSTKQLHDRQAPKSYCHPGHSAVPKPFSEIGKRSARTTSEENTLKSLQMLGIGPKDNIVESTVHYLKKANFQVDPKTKMPHPSTRIIVLKPSSGKFYNTKNQSLSLRSAGETDVVDLKYKEITVPENGASDNEIAERANTVNSMEPLTNGFISPKIMGQTRNIVHNQVNHSLKLTSRAESSNDHFLKAEVFKPPSSNLFSKRREDDSPNSFSKRSFFSKEAKKQIIERWKQTNDLQEVEIAARRQSLGEMLARVDFETRPQFSDSRCEKCKFCSSFSVHSEMSGSCNPMGISSTDGWKDQCCRNSPNLKHSVGSMVVSKGGTTGNKTSSGWRQQKVPVAEKISNSMNEKQKDGMEYRDLRSSMLDKSSDTSSPCVSSSCSPTVAANEMTLDERESMLKKGDWYRGSYHGSKVSEYSAKGLTSALVNANAENNKSFDRIFDDHQAESIPCDLFIKDGDTYDISVRQKSWTESCQRQSISAKHIDPEFPRSSKETDQCSPNSVLGPPFEEEKLYNSESCDSPAGLSSVAMEFQYLETSSEGTYSEGSKMGVSSDEDSERGSLDILQDSENILKDFKPEEERNFSYLVDVLDEAGMNLGMGFEKWNSLECPVNHSVFDLLEKKFGKQASWLKSERKLLFDRINSGLSEILHSFLDIYKMEKSLKRRFCSTLRRNDVEEELWKILVSQVNEVHKDLSGKAIGNETKWLLVEEEIGSICIEIEKFLFDELAAELAYVE